MQLAVPDENETLHRRIGGVPKEVSAVNEAVSLLYRQSKIKIWPTCLGIDALHDDGGVRLAVAELCQIKPHFSSVHIDHDRAFGPAVDVPLAVLDRRFDIRDRGQRR